MMKKMYISPEMIIRGISLEGPLADSYTATVETPDPEQPEPGFEMGDARQKWTDKGNDIWED